MRVPAPPAPDLVVAQSDVLFALLQGAFDPVALPLHERQAGRRRVVWGVAEAVLELSRGVDLPTHDQMPRPGLGFFAIPQPHPPMQNFHPQRAFRTGAQGRFYAESPAEPRECPPPDRAPGHSSTPRAKITVRPSKG